MPDIDDLQIDPDFNLDALKNLSSNGEEHKNDPARKFSPNCSPLVPLEDKKDPIEYLDLITLEKFWNERRRQFVRRIMPQYFIKNLVCCNVFNKDDKDKFEQYKNDYTGDINNPSDRIKIYEKLNEYLFDQLLCKLQNNSHVIYDIIEALKLNDWHPSLAKEWEHHLNDRFKQNSLNLNIPIIDNGKPNKPHSELINFPEPISYGINRESKYNEVLMHLESFSKNEKGGWLVIHGMRGSGKTVLAESSLRNMRNPLFEDGVYWITIGDLKKENMFDQALYSKLEILFDSVNYFHKKNINKPDQSCVSLMLENIEYKLRTHFRDHPRSLLILDDVQSREVLEHFRFGIPVLLTTFDKGIVPRELNNLKFVSTEGKNGCILNHDESLCLLKNCLPNKTHYDYLKNSNAIQNIMKQIDGFPYCIPLIANYMFSSYENCFLYNDETFNELETDWDKLSEMIQDTKKNEVINFNLLDKSIEQMDQSLVDCFFDFGIFQDPVSISVLETLWGFNSVKTKKILQELSDKSLIKSHYLIVPGGVANLIKLYNVHDITANYLHTKLGKEKLKERHSKLVETYLTKYCLVSSNKDEPIYDFAKLPKDKYMYRSLSYHIYSAQRYDLFPKIFFDLNFLQNKINLVGKSHILSDYHYFERYFHEDKQKLKNFRQFIASNTDICNPEVDLFQVALCQSNSSIIYNEAKQIVDGNNDKFYFNWCNKENFLLESQQKKISFRCENGAKYAALSPDSKFIISINDFELNLWDANTGESLFREEFHNNTINHCTFSSDGQFILTCSDDGNAVLWNLKKKPVLDRFNSNESNLGRRRRVSGNTPRLINYRVFTPNFCKFKFDATAQMNFPLKCGDISPNNHYVILGNSSGFIYFFDIINGKQVGTLPNDDGLEYEIFFCSFCPTSSDLFLFTLSQFVYIYTYHPDQNNNNQLSFNLISKLEHEKHVYNAVFGTKLNSSQLTIFTSSEKNILQWKLKRRKKFIPMWKNKMIIKDPKLRYVLPGDGNGHISICAVSSNGRKIAGFEETRREIYFWNRGFPQSVSYLHTLAPIITMSFSKNDECLFALNSKNEITLWDIKEKNAVISVVDLENDFAATFNEKESILNVLTIDKKGFLRLFKGSDGKEDKDFKESLKKQLSCYFDYQNESSSILMLPISIICCDIFTRNISIFCTNFGHVFFYNHTNFELLSFKKDEEEIIQCKFLPTDQVNDIRFITLTREQLNLYRIDWKSKQIRNFGSMSPNRNKMLESFHLVSSQIIIVWSRDSEFYLFDCIESKKILSIPKDRIKSRILSINSHPFDDENYHIVVALADYRLLRFRFKIQDQGLDLINSPSLGRRVPRCCQICSHYIVFGCDNGDICLISCDRIEEPLANLAVNPTWIQSHGSMVYNLAISPDERFIVSSADSIKLWQKDGHLLQTFITHGNVPRLFVHFHDSPFLKSPEINSDCELENGDDNEDDHFLDQFNPKYETLNITIVAMTDAKSLYILENYRK